jgi:type IV secretory pathway VirD2 relaxase
VKLYQSHRFEIAPMMDGSDLVISRDYISHGLRSRAEELVSAELGPKPEVRLASVER